MGSYSFRRAEKEAKVQTGVDKLGQSKRPHMIYSRKNMSLSMSRGLQLLCTRTCALRLQRPVTHVLGLRWASGKAPSLLTYCSSTAAKAKNTIV